MEGVALGIGETREIQSNAGTSPPTTPGGSDTKGSDNELRANDIAATEAPTPSVPVVKVHKESSIRRALLLAEEAEENEQPGLLKWLKKASDKEHRLQVAREHEKLRATQEDREYQERLANVAKEERKREGARLRKRNERARKKDADIASGLRSPGGTKRKVWFVICRQQGK